MVEKDVSISPPSADKNRRSSVGYVLELLNRGPYARTFRTDYTTARFENKRRVGIFRITFERIDIEDCGFSRSKE